MSITYEQITKWIDSLEQGEEKYNLIDRLVEAKTASWRSAIPWEPMKI